MGHNTDTNFSIRCMNNAQYLLMPLANGNQDFSRTFQSVHKADYPIYACLLPQQEINGAKFRRERIAARFDMSFTKLKKIINEWKPDNIEYSNDYEFVIMGWN